MKRRQQQESGVTYAGQTTQQITAGLGITGPATPAQQAKINIAGLGLAMGGLGAATLEIGRNGAFQNIRVQNMWAGSLLPTPAATFLSVHARAGRGQGVGRLLQLEAPTGLDPVRKLTYTGRFPFTEIRYEDDALPCEVSLEAFSPFVPQNAADSSLPLVFFTVRLRNRRKQTIQAAAALSWVNDISAEPYFRGWPACGNRNTLIRVAGAPAVLMDSRQESIAGSEYLLSCLPSAGVRYRAVADWWQGAPGRWMGPNFKSGDEQAVIRWRRFLEHGRLPEESNYDDGLGQYSYHKPAGAVAGEVDLKPGETKEIRFALVWCFPWHYDRLATMGRTLLGHQYVTRFPNGTRAVAAHAFGRRDILRERSGAWRALIEESSLPPKLRALMTEICYLLPRITWWLADGRFVFYESIDCTRLQATILDIYIAPVMAALFPELHAQALRCTAAAQLESGEIPSTLGAPGVTHHEYRVFSPGDASVFPITTVWEMLWGGDRQFVAEMYPVIKKTLQWGKAALDVDGDGVPDVHGIDQGWDTFPMQGAAAYIADQWIAGVMVGEKIARYLGDSEFVAWCEKVRRQAARTAEKQLWNGRYYDLYYRADTKERSSICFADQFSYGTVAAGILELGDVHPRARIRKSLETIWRLNVEPCAVVCRMGSNADGSPADSSVHQEQAGAASQSNSFTPVSVAPMAAAAIQQGLVDQGLDLAEEMAGVIIDRVKGPWSGQLLFNSQTGECFYGLHYSDCLIVWDLMYALLGVHVNMLERSLKFAPPRIPVKMPLFGRLFYGQVEFAVRRRMVTLTMTNAADQPSLIDTLTLELPADIAARRAVLEQGQAAGLQIKKKVTVLRNVVIAPRGQLVVQWQRR